MCTSTTCVLQGLAHGCAPWALLAGGRRRRRSRPPMWRKPVKRWPSWTSLSQRPSAGPSRSSHRNGRHHPPAGAFPCRQPWGVAGRAARRWSASGLAERAFGERMPAARPEGSNGRSSREHAEHRSARAAQPFAFRRRGPCGGRGPRHRAGRHRRSSAVETGPFPPLSGWPLSAFSRPGEGPE